MTKHERAVAIATASQNLGFDAIGFADATPLTFEYDRYEQWIAEGKHGTMGYMARNAAKRRDVSELLPDARTVVVVACTYDTPLRHPKDSSGKVSRYAWGDDYHDVMAPMLDDLCAAIVQTQAGSACRRFVDTGPVLEKQWAVRAGLAWQGKHSNVLRRDIGSYFFLGVIITTAEFEATVPIADHCGSCTACIDACPTQAIVEPYVVDGTKCISYWTIETKSDVDIPIEIAEHLDGWIFGCDVCQDVCPWNRFRKETTKPEFSARLQESVLNPNEIVNLQSTEFQARFAGSPLQRPKLEGLQRNARALIDPTNEQPCTQK